LAIIGFKINVVLLFVVMQVSSAKDEFLKRVFAVAFTETCHSSNDVPDFARDFFTKVQLAAHHCQIYQQLTP